MVRVFELSHSEYGSESSCSGLVILDPRIQGCSYSKSLDLGVVYSKFSDLGVVILSRWT